MNNILFNKQANKHAKKNIYWKCSHILHTHTTDSINHGWLQNLRGKTWFNIGGNRYIVNRYRLDLQFHCSYLESRGVPEKNAWNFNIGGRLSLLNFRFLWHHFGDVISGSVISGDVISGDEPPHDPPQMINGWCIYTTNTEILNDKIKRNIK